jgi:RNA polymerase sigma-70 factor, ECF subfamily
MGYKWGLESAIESLVKKIPFPRVSFLHSDIIASEKHLSLTRLIIENEQKLVEKAKQNSEAFRPLYEHYYKPIFLFVLGRMGDKELTADLTSQVFLKALQGIGKYTDQGLPFSAWLYRIAINEINMFFRKQKHERFVTLDAEMLINLHEELTSDLSAEHLQGRLTAMLQKLSETELHILELRFFERLSFKEIAEILTITEVNAKVRVYRTLDKLKKYFIHEK